MPAGIFLTVSCNYSQDLALLNNNLEIIGYSVIIQNEVYHNKLITGLLVGSVSTMKFTLLQIGKYRITVFPIIGLSFDYSFSRYMNISYSKIFYILEINEKDNDTNGNTITRNNGN